MTTGRVSPANESLPVGLKYWPQVWPGWGIGVLHELVLGILRFLLLEFLLLRHPAHRGARSGLLMAETLTRVAAWGLNEIKSLKFLEKNTETWNPKWCCSFEQSLF